MQSQGGSDGTTSDYLADHAGFHHAVGAGGLVRDFACRAQADTTPVGMCTVVVETEDKNFPCELVYDEASGTCEVVVHFSDESSITYLAGDACTE